MQEAKSAKAMHKLEELEAKFKSTLVITRKGSIILNKRSNTSKRALKKDYMDAVHATDDLIKVACQVFEVEETIARQILNRATQLEDSRFKRVMSALVCCPRKVVMPSEY